MNESDPLDRPATPEEIETVERLLKRALSVVPLRRRGRCRRLQRNFQPQNKGL